MPSFIERCVELAEDIDLDQIGRLIADFYDMPDNGAGGRLHIVLDDSNWEDSNIDFCERAALDADDQDCAALCRLLRRLSMAERMTYACGCGCMVCVACEDPIVDEVVTWIEPGLRDELRAHHPRTEAVEVYGGPRGPAHESCRARYGSAL